MNKRALVIGCGGMDGSHLCDVLLARGYTVFGTSRRSSVDNLVRVSHIKNKITVLRADLTDPFSLRDAIQMSSPDEIYNEADQDNVSWSQSLPGYSVDVTIKGVSNLLEVLRRIGAGIKLFQPVSATMFGDTSSLQNEESRHNPLSPYACAKLAVYHLCRYYRQTHGLFVSTGILYNHDSPRRGKGYLLQDIRQRVIDMRGDEDKILLVGSLTQKVDIGYAREFMEGACNILQLDNPHDIILSSGRGVMVRDVAQACLDYYKTKAHIQEDSILGHGATKTELIGDFSKVRRLIGWNPQYNALNMFHVLDT